uniref:Uncharacterized protein n=1 Tax=Oryza nivara TaxID=4536 RepID=A0A0E0GV41_ORYNI
MKMWSTSSYAAPIASLPRLEDVWDIPSPKHAVPPRIWRMYHPTSCNMEYLKTAQQQGLQTTPLRQFSGAVLATLIYGPTAATISWANSSFVIGSKTSVEL